MEQTPAAGGSVQFPQIDLDASAPAQTYHRAVLTFNVVQDGAPFFNQVTTYDHCSPAVIAFLTGSLVAMGGPMGPKGNKPKNQQFDISIDFKVDGRPVTSGSWNGLSREGAWAFERHVLEVWLAMNENNALTNKAHGKF